MVSYADVCLFSHYLTTTTQPRLSRDDVRDSRRYSEEVRNAVTVHAPKLFPRYDGQYHIDFWLSKAEDSLVRMAFPEEDKCDRVANVFSEDVFKAYDAMQQSRIRRGEAAIKDWPTLKAILRFVFLPLEQLLDTTLVQQHLPSTPDPVNDLTRKADSLSLSSSSTCSCSNNKDVDIKDRLSGCDGFERFQEFFDKLYERDVLKEMIDASKHKLALVTKENQAIHDLLVQCSRMLSPAPSTKSSSTLHQDQAPANSASQKY